MFPAARLHLKTLLLWVVPLAGLACGGDGGTDVVLPPLRITTVTSGVEVDPDGYNVSIDGQAAQPVGPNATLIVDRIADGQHTVELTGIAGNCAVGGQNPQAVSVASGATATLTFDIACSSGTGSIQVSTTTSGSGTDPDGFALLLDGTGHGPIGVSAASSLTGLTAGSHSVGLTGLSGNCLVSGENPRAVSVQAGATAQVVFTVSCTVPGATTGTLEIVTVTTGPAQDADGYLVSIDGSLPGQPIATNATVTLANVPAGLHTVELRGLAANCAVTGSNPVGVAVGAGDTNRVTFTVTCAATVGSLALTISGLPSGANAAVTVTGPNSFSQLVIATRTLTGLTPGSYAVSAQPVVNGPTTYTPNVSQPTVSVAVGATATVAVSYTGSAAPTLNLNINGSYLTQSTQTFASAVPLVAGRAGFLRVFVLANEANTARPTVRVRLSRPGAAVQTLTIPAPTGQTPTQVQEGAFGSSWNIAIPASAIQPGLSIEATVDPGGSITESNEGDNQSTKALTVRSVPTARIRFVSVQQGSSAPGNVSSPDQLMALARRMHPINDVEVGVRAGVFTASQPLEANRSGWDQVLSDLDALRVADPDGANRIYFGIAGLAYGRSQGIVGLAFTGVPSATTALGWDNSDDASRVVAHELGHIWGRRHSPCGNPPDLDALYPGSGPYAGGKIGVYGLDMTPPITAADLRARSNPDIMGYCFDSPWVSDYTYQGVMNYRQANASAVLAGLPQPSVLVWGRIVNGQPVLEPAFQLVTRPSLPTRPGPYSVSATGADGSRLFSLSFDVAATEGQPAGNGHFAFAVPLDQARAAQLMSLRLAGPGGSVVAESRAGGNLRMATPGIVARREGENVALRWNATTHPTIMVRDPQTGEVLSFARGGSAQVRTTKAELDLDVSDGVRSQRLRLGINRP